MMDALSELPGRLRSLLPLFALAALALVFGVFVVRRAGLLSEQVVVTDPRGTSAPASADASPVARELRMVTLLPKDAIPAIFDPTFVSAEEADAFFDPDDLVIGVSIEGDHRAYGTAFLSNREVVNDVVGGEPIAVTW
jgi:hypothetical protein